MWKPSRELVTWILVILLIWNLFSLLFTFGYTLGGGLIDRWERFGYYDTSKGLYILQADVNWWTTEMGKIDNSPRIIASRFGEYVEKLSSSDEIWCYGFKIQRAGDDVKLDTGEVLSSGDRTTVIRHDWLKNFFLPWMLGKPEYHITNEGRFENLILVESWVSPDEVENVVESKRWENLDFVLVKVSEWYLADPNYYEFSPWGPIHLAIVLGALIFVKKRWH